MDEQELRRKLGDRYDEFVATLKRLQRENKSPDEIFAEVMSLFPELRPQDYGPHEVAKLADDGD
ncbi:MAG TPA: hypothetical protein VMT17_14235 [Anaeromyxobacteraceae bacterium]|nr:hypothetical protein [Anaeromyxobacteraceae bacterium]